METEDDLGIRVWVGNLGKYVEGCVCSIESGPCERVESLQMSGRF